MTLATGDTAKIIMGLLLIAAGSQHLWDALRSGYIPYDWFRGDRIERPIAYWVAVSAYVGLGLAGADLLLGGLFHFPTFLG